MSDFSFSKLHNQARIATKEETIQKYQDLLKQARDDMQEMNHKHETELKVMQQKIHMSTDAAFNRFKEAAKEMLHRPTADLPSNKQVGWRPVYLL